MKDMIGIWIATEGWKVGLSIFTLVWTWDILIGGISRGFLEYNIGTKGFVVGSIGIGLCLLSWFLENHYYKSK